MIYQQLHDVFVWDTPGQNHDIKIVDLRVVWHTTDETILPIDGLAPGDTRLDTVVDTGDRVVCKISGRHPINSDIYYTKKIVLDISAQTKPLTYTADNKVYTVAESDDALVYTVVQLTEGIILATGEDGSYILINNTANIWFDPSHSLIEPFNVIFDTRIPEEYATVTCVNGAQSVSAEITYVPLSLITRTGTGIYNLSAWPGLEEALKQGYVGVDINYNANNDHWISFSVNRGSMQEQGTITDTDPRPDILSINGVKPINGNIDIKVMTDTESGAIYEYVSTNS